MTPGGELTLTVVRLSQGTRTFQEGYRFLYGSNSMFKTQNNYQRNVVSLQKGKTSTQIASSLIEMVAFPY